ncbi:MAG: glycosyltransferase family 9 protein [Planctomycetes bacterium]|nr:glycosyltransferase family 9 protein [Planctomycetota bacterium]
MRSAEPLPIQRLQAADRLLGPLVLAALQPWRLWRRLRPRRPAARVERVLLVKFWGLGSLQLLTPAVHALRTAHPGARLELLTLSENGDFAAGLEGIDEVLRLDVRCAGWGQVSLRILRLLLELRDRRYDLCYDFEFFTRFSAFVTWVVGAPRSAGFHAPSVWRGSLHTREVTFNRYWHVARNFRALAGDDSEVSREELAPYRVLPADREALARRLGATGPYVVVNVNAGRLSLERRWPRERFAEVARRVLARTDRNVVLVGSAGERDYVGEVTRALGADEPRVRDLCGQLTMGELTALLAGADLVLSNDSGPMHLAAALGAPTLGLFGPETPLMYAPLGPRARALYRPTVCSPCINVHANKVANCIHGRPECLMNLGVEEVWDAVAAELAEGAPLYAFRPRSLGLGDR